MITDGDEIARNNLYQSDVVSIFLNLSAIPDECIRGLEISNEDYSTNYKKLFADYIKRNPMKGMGKSSLQTWLKLYDDFLEEREKEDQDKLAAERAILQKC